VPAAPIPVVSVQKNAAGTYSTPCSQVCGIWMINFCLAHSSCLLEFQVLQIYPRHRRHLFAGSSRRERTGRFPFLLRWHNCCSDCSAP
jgi:hypothetical protein